MQCDLANKKVAIVGMGLLGRGIAACFLGHGFDVVTYARSRERNQEAYKHIERMVNELVTEGGFPPALKEEWKSRLIQTSGFEELKDCAFVVESVLEDVAVKHEVLDNVEAVVSPETIIASNSSAIPISRLQQDRKHPERMIGMHWAEPAHATRFLEMVRGVRTSPQTVARTAALGRRLGKEPTLCQKEVAGFIVNRIGYAMYREALTLVEAGVASVEDIDRSMRNALGLWATICGPFRWIDLTGGPELYAKAMEHVLPGLNKSEALPKLMQELAASGARGVANGRGFYQYSPEEAERWEALFRKHAWRVAQLQNEYFPLKKK
jgi:3-hydroxybutyryl-CoA dehydrogenase